MKTELIEILPKVYFGRLNKLVELSEYFKEKVEGEEFEKIHKLNLLLATAEKIVGIYEIPSLNKNALFVVIQGEKLFKEQLKFLIEHFSIDEEVIEKIFDYLILYKAFVIENKIID